MILNKIVDIRLHNFQVFSCKFMRNIKVRYFAFVSLLLTLFTTANRIQKIEDFTQPQSFNSPLVQIAIKKSNTHVEIDEEEIPMQSISRLGRRHYVRKYMVTFPLVNT